MASVSFQHVSKLYNGDVSAVSDVSLEISDGEFFVVVGPSGCGKTTLLKLLAGFLRPDTGRILVGDQVLSTKFEIMPPDKRKMSMVFQTYAIWPHKTVFQNVAYGLQVRKMKKNVIAKKVEDALSLVQLGGFAKRYSTELSGGQQQRLSVAMALVSDPEIAFLDEPTTGLDPQARRSLWSVTEGIRSGGRT